MGTTLAQDTIQYKDSATINKMEEVIISATRTIRKLSSQPLPAQIVSAKEIIKTNATTLDQVLAEQTGLLVIPDFGNTKGLQIQGLGSDHSLILIDGAPLIGRTAGVIDLARINTSNIKQIEIVKGASSSLYGNDALAGIVNIITTEPSKGFDGSISLRYGTFNSLDASLLINYKKNKIGITTSFNHSSSDGYDLVPSDILKTVDPYSKNGASVKFLYTINPATNLTYNLRYFNQSQDLVQEDYQNEGTIYQGNADLQEWAGHLKFEYKKKKWNTFFELYNSHITTEEKLLNFNSELSSFRTSSQYYIRPELRAVRNGKKNILTAGLGTTYEQLRKTDFSFNPEYTAPYLFLQYDIFPTKKLNIIAGLRYDHHSAYQSQVSPKGAIRYILSDKIVLKTSVGYGFKAPDFRQLYYDFTNSTVGYTILGYNVALDGLSRLEEENQLLNSNVTEADFNSKLNPENSINYNIGTDFKITEQLKFSMNLFKNHVFDLIDLQIIGQKKNAAGIYSYHNINEAFTQGIEANGKYQFSSNLTLEIGYQFLEAKDQKALNDFKNGLAYALIQGRGAIQLAEKDYLGLPNRSKHTAVLKLFYNIPKWDFNISIRGRYRSAFGLSDTNGTLNGYLDRYDDLIEAHTLWNISLNKKLGKRMHLNFGVDNLFDFKELPKDKEDINFISSVPGKFIYTKISINL